MAFTGGYTEHQITITGLKASTGEIITGKVMSVRETLQEAEAAAFNFVMRGDHPAFLPLADIIDLRVVAKDTIDIPPEPIF